MYQFQTAACCSRSHPGASSFPQEPSGFLPSPTCFVMFCLLVGQSDGGAQPLASSTVMLPETGRGLQNRTVCKTMCLFLALNPVLFRLACSLKKKSKSKIKLLCIVSFCLSASTSCPLCCIFWRHQTASRLPCRPRNSQAMKMALLGLCKGLQLPPLQEVSHACSGDFSFSLNECTCIVSFCLCRGSPGPSEYKGGGEQRGCACKVLVQSH